MIHNIIKYSYTVNCTQSVQCREVDIKYGNARRVRCACRRFIVSERNGSGSSVVDMILSITDSILDGGYAL